MYDYLIAGSGMSGLSLAYYLNKSKLSNKKVLLIDRERKEKNDRTWCFWERGDGSFEEVVFRKWPTVRFYGSNFEQNLDLGNYAYKMIRGKDFYEYIWQHLNKNPNIEFLEANIQGIEEDDEAVTIKTDKGDFQGAFAFDSTYQLKLNLPKRHNLLQHFKGWVIETPQPIFNPSVPYLMDFRVEQHQDCRFIYVMPFDEKRALVEFTLFTPALLPSHEYDEALKDYLQRFWQLTDYLIVETEFGIIPMTDEPIEEYPGERIVRIGTAGGYTKASTGYTFRATQKYLQGIVENLVEIGQPFRWREALSGRFRLYDSIFLNVLQKNRYPAKGIFTLFFKRNKPETVFRFLDEETSITEELCIFSTLPTSKFLQAAADVIRRRIK